MLRKKNTYNVALVGATGTVGKELIELLNERTFPGGELVPLASEHSEGGRIACWGRTWTIKRLTGDAFRNVDIAFFAAGAPQSLEFAPQAVMSGAVVIDTSSAFRMDMKVPLVVPEVNPQALLRRADIVASPSGSIAGLVSVVKPLHDAATVKRITVTMLQSVSGDGKKGIDELAQQTVSLLNFRELEKNVYHHQSAFNCVPHIGDFLDNGNTREEVMIANETRKILEHDSLQVTVTAVRVPVFRGHSAVVCIETEKRLSSNEVRAFLSAAPGVVVYDDTKKNIYPMAIDIAGKDETYVGRIREDESVPNGINLWLVTDNIRKGAALNAVQIAESLITHNAPSNA
jgi:aspartate-semialdehyde dehydrogenase